MRLGLFLILPQPAGRSQREVFATALEDAVAAERLGFDSVWVTEHHGSAYGLAASPSVIAAAIAARTEHIAIGYAVNVTPLHHPVRLADDVATVDHLSGGRVIAGFGSGYSPVEYQALGANFSDRHRQHRQAIAAIIAHWRGNTGLRPRQLPHPPVTVTGATPETAAWAGQNGFGLLTLGDEQHTARLNQAYSRSTGSRSGRFGLLRSICVVEEEAADAGLPAQVRAATRWTLEHRNRMVEQPPPTAAELATYLKQRTLVGPRTMLRRALQRLAALGVDELLCWCRWGSLADTTVRATMHALCRLHRLAD